MKKVFFVLIFSTVLTVLCSAQGVSVKAASRRTAERCLKLAENYLLSGDSDAALSQAELGLSYDDSISDLFYIKAVCLKELGNPVNQVLAFSKQAKDKNNWIGYNEKGNRILLSDLLSDTGSLDEALEELDRAPFVFSADAEAVRIKTYYRTGTEDAVSKARDKINSARRIYKGDIRFIQLFYNFELQRAIDGGKDYKPELIVLQTADVLSQELKNYKEVPVEIESAAIFFMEGEKQIRALKAFDASGKPDILFPVTSLKAGYWTEEKAFDEFFKYADESVALELLSYFTSLLSDEKIINEKLFAHLNAFSGLLYADPNNDLLFELKIQYERGRPQYIHYDAENDGLEDIYAVTDFGELLSANIAPLEVEMFWSDYPYLGRSVLKRNDDYVVFDFSKKTAIYSPFEFETPFRSLFGETEDQFFVPFVKSNWKNPENLDYLVNATFIKLDSPEREKASVTYSMLNGTVVSAVYTENETVFATAEFNGGLPLWRISDYDHDGLFETREEYEFYTDENKGLFSDSDKIYVKNAFPFFDFSDSVYLSSIQIDSNNDNIPEYREYFREKGGKTSVWIKQDGRSESFIVYPKEEGSPLIEEALFVVGLNQDTVSVLSLDGVPSSVKVNDVAFKVVKGELENFFWFDEEGDGDSEVHIAQKLVNAENGFVIPVQRDEDFFTAIKVSGKIFARKIPLTPKENESGNKNENENE